MIQYTLLIIFIFVFPVVFGKLVYDSISENESRWFCLLYGWIVLFAVFEIVSVPTILMKKTLDFLCGVYSTALICVFALLVFIRRYAGNRKKKRIPDEKWSRLEIFVMICAIGIIAFQVFFVVWKTHMDADDTFYIRHAVTSLGTNLMFQINPYTGASLESFPINYVLSPLSMFWAYLSRMTGVHPAITAHIFIPIIFIPMAYSVAYLIAKRIFGESRLEIGLFMVLYAVLQQYGYVSVFTSSTFLLFRIWQGKAMLANVFLPSLFLLTDIFLQKDDKKWKWIILLLASLATCCCSSMGVILGAVEMALLIMVYFVTTKKVSVLLKGILICLPYIVFGCMYVGMKM